MLTTNNQKPHPIRLRGGLDTSTAPMSVAEGALLGSKNYVERVLEGGYERIAGYERYDGRPRPSDAEVTALQGSPSWSVLATVGSIATGAISGATGVICYWSDTLLALTKVSGTFTFGEQLMVGGTPVGQCNTSPSVPPLTLNVMMAGAAAIYRADIGLPPGSGPLCGACVVDGKVYAFRNNAGGTGQDVWRATNAGWVNVPLHRKVRFSNGSITAYGGAGFTLTQGGVTATVYKLMVETGDLGAGTAAGTLVVDGETGGSLAAGTATGLGGSMTLAGATSPIVLYPGGRWQFKPYRFSLVPSAVDEVVYGVDRTTDIPNGGGNFIEFDGSVVAPITAGGIDGPYRLETHKQSLFIVYRKTSVQFSGLGDPYRWTVLSGAGEMLAGQEVTEMLSVQGSENQAAMLVLCRDRTFILYGNSSADFKLTPLSRQIGAKKYSAQNFEQPMAFDEQGVRGFSPTNQFGNFTYETYTNRIRRNVVGKTPVGSAIDRVGGHYRVFFSDGTWLSGTPVPTNSGTQWSWQLCAYDFTPSFVCDWELNGESVILAGGPDGHLYMLDKGRSFDGAAIEAWFKTAYAACGTPWQKKTFKRLELEIRGESAGELQVMPDYSYGDSAISVNAPAAVANTPVPPPATPWDLGPWDKGTWDSQYATLLSIRSGGSGVNASITVYSNSATELSHHITSALHFLIPRKQKRG